jgi:type IV secretory pathway TrbD component
MKAVLSEEDMFLVFVIPMFLFHCGLGISMWTETQSTRRNAAAVDPMFSKKRR